MLDATDTIPHVFTLPEMLDHFRRADPPSPAEIETAMARLGRNWGPALLHHLRTLDLLTEEAATACAGSFWSSAEFPQQQLSQRDWRELFQLAGYTSDGRRADRPPEPLTLYRATPAGLNRRWSWTDDIAVAQKFMEIRSALPGTEGIRVWTAKVEPWRLFARIHEANRSESEYVIDTKGLAIAAHQPES